MGIFDIALAEESSLWLWFRVIGCVAAFVGAPFAFEDMRPEFENQPPSWTFVAVMFAFGLFSVVIITTAAKWRKNYVWSKPSWRANPFKKLGIQLGYDSAWTFILLGISTALYALVSGSRDFMFAMFLSIGLGMMLGVKLEAVPPKGKFKGENAA